MKLRSHLISLTLAALLPMALFAAVIGASLLDQQRESFFRGTEQRALGVMTAVDTKLNGFVATLTALSQVRSLDQRNLALFRETAEQILASQETWITLNLALPSGQQVMNLQAPEGASLPVIAETHAMLEQLTQARKPVIADLIVGPVTKRWTFAVRVPVVRAGKVIYVLSAVIEPAVMTGLLAAQALPAGWEAMLLDRNGRVVARTVQPEKSLGDLATTGMRDALARSPSGWFRGQTLEGAQAYRVYQRSHDTGWTVAMAIPVHVVDGPARRAAWTFALALVGTLGMALLVAQLLARRISRPIAALASATDAMGRGGRVQMPESTKISELHALEHALHGALQAQERLRRTEEQNRSVVDHVLDGIITIDERGTVETFNKAAEKLFGYTASEVIGNNVRMLMPEPYRSEHDAYIANYVATAQARIIGIGREVVGRRKDGSTFPMDLAVSEFRTGAQQHFTGIVRDITERKNSEEALRSKTQELQTILDTAPVQIWIGDAACGRIIGNRAAYEQHGLTSGMNASFDAPVPEIPKGLRLIKDGRDLAPDEMPMPVAARTRQPVSGFEHDVVHADGRRITMWANATPILDDNGNVRSVIGVYLDITQRKRMEEALKEGDRQKDEFLAMVSHELRNPLGALTAAARVLSTGAPADAMRAAGSVVERQTRQMLRLIEDLIDTTRVRMGKVTLNCELLNLAEVVSELVQAWRQAGRLAGRAAVTLRLAPGWVHADRVRVEQIVSNLLDNALKFTPGDGRVEISVTADDAGVMLTVSDSGRGIPPELLGRVFESFAQGEHARERGERGLGLGLAVVQRLAELHGGSVAAESAGLDRGARFSVRFPMPAAPREERPALTVVSLAPEKLPEER